jgi:Fe-S cluster assembly protein SufD
MKNMAVIEQQNVYDAEFGALQERTAGADRWLRDLRERGMAGFKSLGFPTLKNEEWRFTNVEPIATTPFVLPMERADLSDRDLERFGFGGTSAARLVFIDGRYCPELSRAPRLGPGIQVASLGQALSDPRSIVRQYLGRSTQVDSDVFGALNSAFVEDGALVHIGRNVSLEAPIHLLFVSTAGAQSQMSHPRNLIIAEAGSRATVVENYVALDEGLYLSNTLTEAFVGIGAHLNHYLLERDSEQAYAVSTLHVTQERDSRFESHTALLGGAIVRNNVHAELNGTGGDSLINGLYLPRGTQHHDNHMRVVHAAERCASRQFYKGVLNDRARAVFTGRIVVHKAGQKTDAKQTNRNLLLSEEATVNARPQLEIYADDVKCTHGATTGQLDEDQLFYLRARGIDEDAARGLLVFAFAHESLDRMTVAPIRATLERLMLQRLPDGESLRKFI